jgi:protein-disulfide isomerase
MHWQRSKRNCERDFLTCCSEFVFDSSRIREPKDEHKFDQSGSPARGIVRAMDTFDGRRSRTTERLEVLATILLIAVALLVGGTTLWDRWRAEPVGAVAMEPPLPEDSVEIEDAPTLGDRSANVALILFSEFECPFCARSARELLPEIDRAYLATGKAILVWRHYPLAIHANAVKAAEGAECAARQGKFWPFHDWAFQRQNRLDPQSIGEAAKTLGLDVAAFATCFDGQTTARVRADVELGDRLGVMGTPTWFVGLVQANGEVKLTARVRGAKPFSEFQRVLDKAIATAEASRN